MSIDLGFKRARKVFFHRSYKIVILNKMWHSPNDTSGTLFGRWKPGKSKDDCMYFRLGRNILKNHLSMRINYTLHISFIRKLILRTCPVFQSFFCLESTRRSKSILKLKRQKIVYFLVWCFWLPEEKIRRERL